MERKLKDALGRVIHSTIGRSVKRGGAIDPIDLAESIIESIEVPIDMFYEDSGIGSMPPGGLPQAETPAWDIRANAPAPPDDDRPHFLAPPAASKAVVPAAPAASRVLVMPGDPDFNAPEPKGAVLRPGSVKSYIRKGSLLPLLRRSGTKGPARPLWDEAELMQTVIENTPNDLNFEVRRNNGQIVPITVNKNVQSIPGVGASLTYSHPGAGEAIPPAKHVFSIFDEGADMDAAMLDIATQLQGIWVDRSGGAPNPVAVGPEPNLHDYMRTGLSAGSVDINIERDGRGRAVDIGSGVGHKKENDPILHQVMSSMRKNNLSMTPKESPLK